MNATDIEERYAVPVRGELRFSEAQEVATGWTPADEAASREDLEAAVMAAQSALVAAEKRGNHRRIEEAEQALNEAVEALTEWGANQAPLAKAAPIPTRPAKASAVAPAVVAEERESSGVRISLAEALGESVWSGEALEEDAMGARLEAWEALCRFCFEGGRIVNPWLAFKNWLAVVRRVAPQHLGSLSQTELAVLFCETKANLSAREKKVVEGLMRRHKMLGYHLLGGTKSDAARAKCAAAQKGNQNRRRSKRGKKW